MKKSGGEKDRQNGGGSHQSNHCNQRRNSPTLLTLPRALKCVEDDLAKEMMKNLGVDLTQPFLAYCKRFVEKASAHSVKFDPDRHEFVETGGCIHIPEDYVGWFAVLGPPDEAAATSLRLQQVAWYSSLTALAGSNCSNFLVAGQDPIHATLSYCGKGGKVPTIDYPIMPGTVLKWGGLYSKQRVANDRKKKQHTENDTGPQCMICVDDQARAMLVNIQQTGIFYEMAKDKVPVNPPILQMKEILSRYRSSLPQVVKLVHGPVPPSATNFTTIMTLTGSRESHTLVASTLYEHDNINFEIPLETSLKFQAVKTTPQRLTSKAYISAMTVCKMNVPACVRAMKVVGDVQPRTGQDSRDEERQENQAKEKCTVISKPEDQRRRETLDHIFVRDKSVILPVPARPGPPVLPWQPDKASKRDDSHDKALPIGNTIQEAALAELRPYSDASFLSVPLPIPPRQQVSSHHTARTDAARNVENSRLAGDTHFTSVRNRVDIETANDTGRFQIEDDDCSEVSASSRTDSTRVEPVHSYDQVSLEYFPPHFYKPALNVDSRGTTKSDPSSKGRYYGAKSSGRNPLLGEQTSCQIPDIADLYSSVTGETPQYLELIK